MTCYQAVEAGYSATDLVQPAATSRNGRHPRCLPAHRGTSAAGRVLRRHRRRIRPSRSPTSEPRGGGRRAVARHAANCCAPAVRADAERLAGASALPGLGRLAEGVGVEGMEAFAPALADGWNCCSTTFPRAAACSPATGTDPYPWRRALRTSQEFLDASLVNAAAGGRAPNDLAAPLQAIGRPRPPRLGLPGGPHSFGPTAG